MDPTIEHGSLIEKVRSLIEPWQGSVERRYSSLANIAALLWQEIPAINWVGFYVRIPNSDMLVLGPFQGKVACTEIEFPRGVCGKAARTGITQRVDDVHQFPGHIACDGASQSELVVPLKDTQQRVVAVLDVDSPNKARFTEEDQHLLQEVALVLSERLWS